MSKRGIRGHKEGKQGYNNEFIEGSYFLLLKIQVKEGNAY